MQRNAMLSMFAPAPMPPHDRWKFAAVFLALLAFVLMPILLCLAADDADARARTANAKVVFESSDQAVLPDAAPNINLNIRKQGTPAAPVYDPMPSIVRISVMGDNECQGSGVVVDGGVLTSAHLFTEGDGTTRIELECAGETASASIKKINFESDLAFLECRWATPRRSVKFAANLPSVKSSSQITEFGPISTAGRDQSDGISHTSHRLIGFMQRLSGEVTSVIYRPPPFPGRSGGAVFNDKDELIGIVESYGEQDDEEDDTDQDANGYAVSINLARELLSGKDAPRRVVVASMKSCGPCNVLKARAGKGDSDLLIVYADIESPDRPPLVTESEWQWIMAAIADGQGVPFATWLPKGAEQPIRLLVSGMDSKTILHNLNYFDNEANR